MCAITYFHSQHKTKHNASLTINIFMYPEIFPLCIIKYGTSIIKAKHRKGNINDSISINILLQNLFIDNVVK